MLLSPLRPIDVPQWRLTRARVPACLLGRPLPADKDGFALVDIDIDRDRLSAIVPTRYPDGNADLPVADLAGQIALPCFVDAHVHLDKSHIWPRAPNPDGTFISAMATVHRDRATYWTAEDVGQRMEFGLRSAYAYGTIAMRTHIDSIGDQTRVSWPVFAALRERWRGKLDLSATPLFSVERALDEAHMAEITRTVKAFGNTLGAVTYALPALSKSLDCVFRIAADNGFDLDFHVDETNDISADSLRMIAETALKFRFQGRILAGHCCSLALQSDTQARQTIDLVAKACISVVSLPMCNSYLMDRSTGRTPRWRGVTALHELRSAGINVVIASDNARDPFYAYGDLDMLEVLREGTRILQLDHPFSEWTRTVTSNAAIAIGREQFGRLTAESGADLVVFRARDFTELLARPHTERSVIRCGRILRASIPDYSELDLLRNAECER